MKWFSNKIKPSFSPETLHHYFENAGCKDHLICNAPFSGLYFKPSGLIKPCCAYADNLSFGLYPSSTISDALKSTNRKTLQKHLKKHNLSFGCQSCFNSIINENFLGSISSTYTENAISKYPGRIDFELSHFCNLDCIMCNSHTSQNKNNLYDNRFLKQLEPFLSRIKAASFYGGEPFLIDIYYKIWNYMALHNKKCMVHIQSNGTVFNTMVEDVFKKLNVNLGISVDASTKALFEHIRKGADFDKVMKNIQIFNEISKSQGRPLSFSFCPMPINWQEIPQMLNFADSFGSKIFFNTINFPFYFSFNYTPSDTLKKIIKELNKFRPQPSSNPHQAENFRKFQNLICSFENLIEEQLKVEKEFHLPLSLKELLIDIRKKTQNDKLIDEMENLMVNFDRELIVNPYFLSNIKNLSNSKMVGLITDIVKEKNVALLENLFLCTYPK